MGNRKLRVFISSTFTDFKEYRNVMYNSIIQVGMEPVIIEEYITSGQSLVKSLEDEIKNADIFVLILGHRYGTIFQESNKSWVEFEYDIALRINKPILVFLADENEPWSPTQIDVDRTRIKEFRNRVADKIVWQYFSNYHDLSMKLIDSLITVKKRLTKASVSEKQDKKNIKNVRIIRLLLSSPGDVSTEREAVSKVVFRYNQEHLEENEIFLKLIKWKDMAPQIGPHPQEVINKQIGEYDLFVGVMWNRFGTPTDIAASGTEEEFIAAIASWELNKKPWITFYFCERPANFTNNEQLEQKAKVLEFKGKLGTMGVLRKFTTVDEFEEVLYRDLIRILSQANYKHQLNN